LLEFSFVQILNCFHAENHTILIKKDCKRIENMLRKLCSSVKSNFKTKRGDNFITFGRENRSVAIRHGELLTTGDLERELYNLKAVKEALEEESRRLNECCDELYESLIQEEERRRESNDSITEARADTEKLRMETYGNISIKLQIIHELWQKLFGTQRETTEKEDKGAENICRTGSLVCRDIWPETEHN
jgi:type III secretory pathway component EscV